MDAVKNSKFIINKHLKDYAELSKASNPDAKIIYEVVRLIGQKILFFEDHLQRFVDSFQVLSIPLQVTQEEISEQLRQLIEWNDIKNGNVKFQIQVNHSTNKQDFLCYFIPHAYPSENQYKNGVKATILTASRNNPNAKVQNQSLREISDQIIKNENVYEVILVNDPGFVTEGSRSNIFMISGDKVMTPQVRNILPGVTRKNVIKICNKLNFNCIETNVSLNEMLSMDSLFLTGTSPKVLPIHSISDQQFDTNNPFLRTIMQKFDELIENYLKS